MHCPNIKMFLKDTIKKLFASRYVRSMMARTKKLYLNIVNMSIAGTLIRDCIYCIRNWTSKN